MSGEGGSDVRPAKRVKTSPEPGESPLWQPEHLVVQPVAVVTDPVLLKENKVGIAAFVNSARPRLRGLVKKRYADFLVNEVLPGGRVLHLSKTTAYKEVASDVRLDVESERPAEETSGAVAFTNPEDEAMPVKSEWTEKTENGYKTDTGTIRVEDEMKTADQISAEDRAKLVTHFDEKAVTELLHLYDSILQNPKKKTRDHPVVKTEFTSDRTLRAHIHQDIRRVFNSTIDSSTTHEGILVLSAAIPRNQERSNKPRPNKLSWQERGGEYCHFTLYKENKDTMEAISLLARFLKMNPRELSFAGTKDRRAITVQRLSARRVDAERLAALNRTLRMAAVGDFEYAPREVGLGELEGNEFTVTLRECEIEEEDGLNIDVKMQRMKENLREGMDGLEKNGFLNYFGLQRFGTFATRSDVMGLKLLKGDFEGACDAILEYSLTALEDTADVDSISNVGREDRARGEAIRHFRTTGKVNESLNMLPKRFSAESAVIRHLGRSQKDFLGAVLQIQHGMRTMYVHAYQSMVWNKAVSERWRLFGDSIVEGDLVLVREHKEKEDKIADESVDADGEVVIQAEGENRSKMADEIFERARLLRKEEVESGKYDIFDVVLPQPGFDVLYPQNEIGEFYKTFMASGEGGGLDPRDMRRKQRDFSLPGAYRKMVARIGREWSTDVRRYDRDEQHFVETDFEKIRGRREGNSLRKEETKQEEGVHDDGEKIAAVLRFRLGTSQYATMALRELSSGGVREFKPEFSGGR